MSKAKETHAKTIALNKRARREYEAIEVFDLGLVLLGTEVKSLRAGRANIAESYARFDDGELVLVNANIPEYAPAAQFNHAPTRKRKLLANKKQLAKMFGAIERQGLTLVPLKLYFNARGLAKLELAIGRGRKSHDKREVEKKRDWQKQKARLLRERG